MITQQQAEKADLADAFENLRGVVVTYSPTDSDYARSHDGMTQASIGRALAAFQGYDFAGEYDPSRRYAGRLYFVPSDTLVGVELARSLGIRTEDDLYGGFVPYPSIATKAITHPRVESNASAPEGWSDSFAIRVRDVVLPGFTAFSLPDAYRAAMKLLDLGPVRIKPTRGSGWRGQSVIADPAALKATLNAADTTEVEHHGLVLEQNLVNAITCSVGRLRVGGMVATYCGTQRATTNNRGATVYGGSDLVVLRGDFDAQIDLDFRPQAQLAVVQARVYDAATEVFPGLLASRRNYDVVQGYDAQGRWRSGVLEQSWRMGGASGPEIAALAALRAEPSRHCVRTWCIEAYGTNESPPHAIVHYCGIDARVGLLTKYTVVEPHVIAR